jgi:hypothetical protein
MRIRATIFTLLFCVGWTLAGRSQAPEKPIQNIDEALAAVRLPKLSAAEALDIANKLRRSRTPSDGSTIVAIDWCKSSDFRPRYVDGSDYMGLNNDTYAWFITYIEPLNGPAHVRSIAIVRVYDNGRADFVPSART